MSPDSAQKPLSLGDGARYEQLEPLGTGGMGRVYKAWDRVLRRRVALKVLLRDTEDYNERFLREAAAQAQIDHPNVCRIYDTSVIEGQVFIAMQFIDGEPLSVSASSLTLREKVAAIAAAARGIHAAHRLGIIHRDIKPQNLMSWRTETGKLEVVVLDFGLARDTTQPVTTGTGVMMGTLHYMSPEQAVGDNHRVDRRSDVYGLGVTLHELLTGVLPFNASTPVECMMEIVFGEPPTFTRSQGIPRDLETIVLKCLEKDQSRRYDSASDLADDLDRFLAGEPVLGRRAPLHRTLLRRLKRHRLLAVSLLVALTLATVVGFLAVRRASVRGEQATLANRFGEDVRYIEALLRHAYASPLHDVRPEQGKARRRIDALGRSVDAEGVVGRGPGAAAMGAARLALGEVQPAATALEEAWRLGPRTPQLAYSLGSLRGRQYEQRLFAIERIPLAAERERARQKADRELRAPAVFYLRHAQGVKLQSAEYLDALIAYYDRRLEDSSKRLVAVVERYPWLYEARLLAARVQIEVGNNHRDSGNYDAALAAYTAADLQFTGALVTAPSDPDLLTERCRLWRNVLQFEVQSRGSDVTPHLERTVNACNAALTARPDDVNAFTHLSGAWGRFAQWQHKRDLDFRESSEKACAAADRAVTLGPDDEWTHHQRAFAYFWRSSSSSYSHQERLRYATESQTSATRAVALNPNFTHGYTGIGSAALARHNVMILRGDDPREVLNDAIAAYQRAIALDPKFSSPYNNLGHAFTHLGDYQRLIGIDPANSYTRAAEWAAKGHVVNPGVGSPPYVAANAHRLLAEEAVRMKKNPTPHVDEALRWSAVAEKVAQREPGSYLVRALSLLALAEHRRITGASTADIQKQMLDSLNTGVELAPDSVLSYNSRARIALWTARYGGETPEVRRAALDKVLSLRNAVRSRHPESAEAFILTSAVARLRAEQAGGAQQASHLAIARKWRDEAYRRNSLVAEWVESVIRFDHNVRVRIDRDRRPTPAAPDP